MEIYYHNCARKNSRQCAICESGFQYLATEIADYLKLSEDKNDILMKIEEKVRESYDVINETEESFKYKLHETIMFAKGDIDTRVESLKTELDVIRESLFVSLDKKEDELLDHFNLSVSRIELPTVIKREVLNELLEKMQKKMVKLQDLFDTNFSVKFEDSNFDISSCKFGKLTCRINKAIPNLSWRCEQDWEFQEDHFNSIRTFYNSNNDAVKALEYAGEDLVASVDDFEKMKLWDFNTGLLKHTFDMKCYESATFLNDTILVITKSIGPKGFNLYDVKKMQRNFHLTNCKINCLGKTENGCLITGEPYCIRIWKLNGINAEEVGKIRHNDTISLIKYIGNDMIAVISCKDTVKICDLVKLKEVKSFQRDHITDLLAISETRLALLGVIDLLVHDFKNDRYLMRKERQQFCHGRAALFIKLFMVKQNQFGVISSSYAYVFDANSLNCIATVSARTFHPGGSIGQIVALKDGKFASSNNNEICVFDFMYEKDFVKKRKFENSEEI